MSEKDIRETLEALTDDYMKDNYNDMILSAVYGVLDEEPDAVKILRFTTGFLEAAWDAVGNEIVGQEKCAFSVYDAILHIVEYIEGEIGVRLTDDSWKWFEGE